MKSQDVISSLFWMAKGIGVCYGGVDLELGTLHDPGSIGGVKLQFETR